MKRIKGILKVVFASLAIGATINLYYINEGIVPFGAFGLSKLYANVTHMEYAVSLLLLNTIIWMIGIIFLKKEEYQKFTLPIVLVPLSIYFTKGISSIIDLSSADPLLITIFSGVILGFASRIIYQEDLYATSDDITSALSKKVFGPNGDYINYAVEVLILAIVLHTYSIDTMLYSAVSIVIVEWMRKRSLIGISQAKVFYIITSEEKAVRKFIIDTLHYDLTIFDVKGGYSKTKNRVLMSAIPTKDYYKLKEGIKNIDPKAFISITDSYEVINDNVTINK